MRRPVRRLLRSLAIVLFVVILAASIAWNFIFLDAVLKSDMPDWMKFFLIFK